MQLKHYKVTLRNTVEVCVDAFDIYEAERKAQREVYDYDNDDWEIEDVVCEEDKRNTIPTCTVCVNCTRVDRGYRTIDCAIDKIPNGHTIGHCCCLFELNEKREY